MFNIIKESAKNQITEDTIRSYFNAKSIKIGCKFSMSVCILGTNQERVEVPFIIETHNGGSSYLPSYNEIIFNIKYISENYKNVIKFCMDLEQYLKDYPDFNTPSAIYIMRFIFGSLYIK